MQAIKAERQQFRITFCVHDNGHWTRLEYASILSGQYLVEEIK